MYSQNQTENTIAIELKFILLKAIEKTLPFFSITEDATFHIDFLDGNSIFRFSADVTEKILKDSHGKNRKAWEKSIYEKCFEAMSFLDDGTVIVKGMRPEECIHGIYLLVADHLRNFRPTQRVRGEKDSVSIRVPKKNCSLL